MVEEGNSISVPSMKVIIFQQDRLYCFILPAVDEQLWCSLACFLGALPAVFAVKRLRCKAKSATVTALWQAL
jgi:hypothetical protein